MLMEAQEQDLLSKNIVQSLSMAHTEDKVVSPIQDGVAAATTTAADTNTSPSSATDNRQQDSTLNKNASPESTLASQSTTRPQRNLPGTKEEKLYQWPQRPLDSIESAFALREYLQAIIRHDPHNVDLLISLPSGQDENSWLYEHLCQICLELNFLIVHLEPECTPEICPEMRAEEWLYYCATHPTPRECCAIDYLTHTLDGASALLNNFKFFPSRICVPDSSVKNFQSLARRLYRIFAHAYFHHRDIFDAFEAETSLYARFLKLSRTRKMITEKLIIIPSQDNEENSTVAYTSRQDPNLVRS